MLHPKSFGSSASQTALKKAGLEYYDRHATCKLKQQIAHARMIERLDDARVKEKSLPHSAQQKAKGVRLLDRSNRLGGPVLTQVTFRYVRVIEHCLKGNLWSETIASSN